MKKVILFFWALTLLLTVLIACGDPADTTDGRTTTTTTGIPKTYDDPLDVAVGAIKWEEDQMLPWFPEPEGMIEAVMKEAFDADTLLTVTALQGIVNKTNTRFMVLENSEEGATTWSSKVGYTVRTIPNDSAMRTAVRYLKEASGAVLYSPSKSEHYRNLALTVAGLKNAVPMTPEVHAAFKAAGVELPIVENLVSLPYTDALGVYGHLYDNYWKDCEKRLLISLPPSNTYNLHDYSTGVGAATVYLDCMNTAEKALFEKFLGDMTPGKGVVIGWFTSERSGITTVAANGLCTIPGDFFNNASVYSSLPHTIRIDTVPKKPNLENKIYVMFIVSDGDNIQYNQHAMRLKWGSGRGAVPINWTISPALVDIAPNILNYYYDTATDEDCLIAGPSGYGYNLFYNTLAEPGAPIGDYMGNREHLAAYVSVSERYLERAGLRVATIWDKATDEELRFYTKNAPYLWGLTVQDFHNRDKTLTKVVNGKLVQQVLPCYVGSFDEAYNSLVASAFALDKSKPQFLAIQMSVWTQDFSATKIAELEKRLQEKYPQIEFVRADHYYALYAEAKGLDFNIALSQDLKTEAEGKMSEIKYLTDGSRHRVWKAPTVGESSVTFALGGKYDLSRVVLYHAEAAGKNALLNTKDFEILVSSDGVTFTVVKTVTDNKDAISKLSIDAEGVTHLKIVVKNGGDDNTARLADVEIYGKVKK